jgi:hypothetical protein
MNRLLEIVLVIVYNLSLFAGASYLVYYKDASAWLYLVAIIFAASWDGHGQLLKVIKQEDKK